MCAITHRRSLAEIEVSEFTNDLEGFVTDFVAMRPVGNRNQQRSSGSFQALDEPPTLIFYIVYVGYRTDVMKANLYGSN